MRLVGSIAQMPSNEARKFRCFSRLESSGTIQRHRSSTRGNSTSAKNSRWVVGGPTDVPPGISRICCWRQSLDSRTSDSISLRVDARQNLSGRTSGNQVELDELSRHDRTRPRACPHKAPWPTERNIEPDRRYSRARSFCLYAGGSHEHHREGKSSARFSILIARSWHTSFHAIPIGMDRIRDIYLAHCAIDEMLQS